MKSFAVASVLVLVASVAAQTPNLGDLPTCAQSCINLSDIGTQTGCGQFDFKCICSKNSFISSLSCCVAGKCDKADQEKTVQFAEGICKGVGVTLPTIASCSSSGAKQTSASAASGGSSAPVTSGASSTPSSASSAPSSASSGSASSAAAATTGSSSAPASSASAAASPSASAKTGAAAQLVAQGAGAAGGLVAALAALL